MESFSKDEDEDDERQQGIQRAAEWGIENIKHGYFFVHSYLHENQRFVTFRDKKWDAHYIGICTQRPRPDKNGNSAIQLKAHTPSISHQNEAQNWMVTSQGDMGIYFFCYRIDFQEGEMTSHVLTSLRLCPISQSSFYIGQDGFDLRYKWFSDVFYFKDDPYLLDWKTSENEHFVFRYPHCRTENTEADIFQPFMVIPLLGRAKTQSGSTTIKKDEEEIPAQIMFDNYQLQDKSQHYIWKPLQIPDQDHVLYNKKSISWGHVVLLIPFHIYKYEKEWALFLDAQDTRFMVSFHDTDTSYHDPTWRGIYQGMVMLLDSSSYDPCEYNTNSTELDPPVLESNTYPYALLTYDHIPRSHFDACTSLYAANKLPLPMLVTEQKTEIYKVRLQSYMSPFQNQRTFGDTQRLCITNLNPKIKDEPVMMYFHTTNIHTDKVEEDEF